MSVKMLTPAHAEVFRALTVLRDMLMKAVDDGAGIDMQLDTEPVTPSDLIDGVNSGKLLWVCQIAVREPAKVPPELVRPS